MIIPIRCFTCGKVIGHLYQEYERRVNNGENAEDVLDELGLERYCCRRMFISHADLINETKSFG